MISSPPAPAVDGDRGGGVAVVVAAAPAVDVSTVLDDAADPQSRAAMPAVRVSRGDVIWRFPSSRLGERWESAEQPFLATHRALTMPTQGPAPLGREQSAVEAAIYSEHRAEANRAEHPAAVGVEETPECVLMPGGLAGHGSAWEQVSGQIGEPMEKPRRLYRRARRAMMCT
jgi:hypothetical protein